MRGIFGGVLVLSTLSLFCFVTVASAGITGDLKTDSGNGTTTVTLSSITFNTNTAGNPAGPPWNAEVTNTTDLMFSGCPSGVLGTAGCLDSGAFTPAEAVEFANNNPIVAGAGFGPNNPFIQFAGNGISHATLLYTILAFGAGSANTNCAAANAPGLSCSVFAGSPIILTDTATGTNVSITMNGTATDGAGASSWIGQFSTPITGMSPSDIQLFFCPGDNGFAPGQCSPQDFSSGNSITKPSGGDFLATVVPEPGTTAMTLIGLGLVVVARIRRKMTR